MNAEQLKKSLLQMAMQGRLVEQREEEGNARELLEKIQQEKQRLIKEGKIKKEKSLPEITENEKPFDIPENWVWATIPDMGYSELGKTINKRTDKGTLKRYLCSINVYSDGIRLHDVKETFFSDIEQRKYSLLNGDLLICEGGDIGRAAIWRGQDEMYFQNALHRVRLLGSVMPEYILYTLELYKMDGTIKARGKGMTIKHLVTGELYKILFPLPPLAEQRRIVQKLEQLLPLVETYSKAQSELKAMEAVLPVQLKKSLLQMAMQGNLVEQREEEGNARKLLEKIQQEKQRLIKEGKIKKEKSLPEITENEKPFDIPENWVWCYIGDIFQHNTGKALNGISGPGTMLTYITTSNLYWDRFELNKLKLMPFKDSELEKCTVIKNDLLVCEGGDFGRAAIWNKNEPMRIQNHIHRLRCYLPVIVKFFYYIFFFYKSSGLIGGKGIGIKGLSSNALHRIIIPLPPLAEQRRIVQKLEQLLPLCDKLVGN